MKRGTRVGQAYVAVTADGDGINEEIVDSVDKAGPGVDKAADKHSKRYSERFAKTLEALPDKVSKKLDETLGLADRSGAKAGDTYGKSFGKSLGKSLAKNIARELELVISRQLDLFEGAGKVSGNSGGGGSGGTGGGAGGDSEFREGPKQRLIKELDIFTMFESARVALRKASNDAIQKDDAALVKEQRKSQDDLVKYQQRIYNDILKSEQAKITFLGKFETARVKLREASNDAIFKDDQKLLKDQQTLFNKLSRENEKRRRDEDKGANIGRFFGAGSRSSFLNFFGKSLNNTINLFDTLKDKSAEVFKGFETGFKAAEEGASGFQQLLGGLKGASGALGGGKGAGILAALGGAGEAAIPTIIATTAALSVFISVVGGAIGVVTALSATIVSGLVGALLVVGPLIGGLIVAAGLLTLALTSLTDAQRKAFLPIKAAFTGLGQEVLAGLSESTNGFKTWTNNIVQSIGVLLPYVHTLGAAIGEAGNIITASFSGPGFQAFAASLGASLPAIITNLATALGGFLNGLVGTFAVLMPYVLRFSAYLAEVADRFSRWATSAKGQNAIEDFTNRALTSLKSLWGFIKEFSGFLSDVLFSPEAQNAGNTLFDDLADAFASFRDTVKKASADGSLQKWFEDAVKFGETFGRLIRSLGATFIALYNSGSLNAVTKALGAIATVLDILNPILTPLVYVLGPAMYGLMSTLAAPIDVAADALRGLGGAMDWVIKKIPFLNEGLAAIGAYNGSNKGEDPRGNSRGNLLTASLPKVVAPGKSDLDDLLKNGLDALNATSKKFGGLVPNSTKDAFVNPYKEFAERLIDEGPSIASQIKNAMLSLNKQIANAVRDAAKSKDYKAVQSSLLSLIESIKAGGRASVNTAQQALNSAAQSLAGATTKAAAEKALKDVERQQKNVERAQQNQARLDAFAVKLNKQRTLTVGNVQSLLAGRKSPNATLADFARGREILTIRLEAANQKLANAIQVRDQFRTQVADSIKAFGALTTAQAKTINGVEQALTSNDIVSNLKDKLKEIHAFQDNLRILLSRGLSNSAYKQLLDAGVEQGGSFAKALVEGGASAVGQVNTLTQHIDNTANSLGLAASNRMYQAGVDAAQGLVDGLLSQTAQLDAAATKLGNSIADAVKKSLGIKSPSQVMMDQMNYVGDGIAGGLNNQHTKVGNAAAALSDRIAVSPEVAAYAASQGQPATVSGNQQNIDITVVTPTEDPRAVAMETINELTGRL